MKAEIWITTAEAAAITGISERNARKKVNSGEWTGRREKMVSGGGCGGAGYLVALSSLPAPARRKYIKQCQTARGKLELAGAPDERFWDDKYLFQGGVANEVDNDLGDEEPEAGAGDNRSCTAEAPLPAPAKIRSVAELAAKYGDKVVKTILSKPRKREKIVQEALSITGSDREKTRRLSGLAKRRKVSYSTLRRWMAAYTSDGLLGLVDDRYLEPGRGLDAITRRTINEEMRAFVLAMYLREMKPTGAYVHKELQKAAKIKGWKLPSRATIYRLIDEVSKSEEVMSRKGKQAWKAEIRPKTKRNYDNLMVMQETVGDGHTFDIFVEYQGKAIRADLSAWVDLRSRKGVGWCITPQANSESIGLAMKNAIESHGLAGVIYTDNGKDYLSEYIEAVCNDLEIGIRNCIPKSPQSKLIERFFREVHDKFSRYQPGYCGNKPENRPEGFDQKKLLKAGKLMSLETLVERFAAWVEEYNNTVHGALKDTPANVAANVEHFRPGVVNSKVLEVLFMKRTHVKVHDGYIRLFGRDFWTFGTDIDWLIGQYVEVWYDFNNMGQVLIKHNGKVVGTAMNKKALDHGESRAELTAEQRAKAKFEKDTRRRINAYAQGIPDELDGILPEDVLKRKRGRYLTKSTGAGADNVRRITGHEKDAADAVEALAAAGNPKPAPAGRAKQMLLEEGKRALANR